MQHDTFRAGHGLDLRSNFENDLLRQYYSLFDASRREEHDAGKINVETLLSETLLQKNAFSKNCYFCSFCHLEAKLLT